MKNAGEKFPLMTTSDQTEESRWELWNRAPVGSASVVDRLVSALGRDIASGVWKPDETLPTEPEISHRFGAGRNAVREAVKILAAKGLVRTERRTGTVVRPERCWNLFDPQVLNWMLLALANRDDMLNELSELRSIIEPAVAALAATHASSMEALRIFELYEQMEQGEMQTFIDANIAFHQRLFEAAHNRLFINLIPAFSLLLRTSFEISIRAGKPAARNLKEHRQIVEAVSRRDPDAARRATRKLLQRNAIDLAEMIKRERRNQK